MKEAILKVLGQDITVQLTEKNFIRYGKNSIKEWMVKDGFDEDSVDEDLKNKNDFLTRKQTYAYLKENYSPREYKQKFNWLKKAEPEILRLMKKVSNGTQLRIINGLVVREHPEVKDLYSLTDAHKAARSFFESEGKWKAKSTHKWQLDFKGRIKHLRKEISKTAVGAVLENPLILSKPGRYGGTYAHPRLLIAYTEFVHPRLHNKVLKVFEDYETGKLHSEETLSRRAKGTATREKSKPIHLGFRGQCQKRGANWMMASGQMHVGLWEKTKKQKMKEDGIKEPVRDNMLENELQRLSAAESLAIVALIESGAEGSFEVQEIAGDAGKFIRKYGNSFVNKWVQKVPEMRSGKSNVLPFRRKAG